MSNKVGKYRKVYREKDRFLYREIRDILRNDILSEKVKQGSRLPSADELSKTYSVNRLTVRRAISGLIAEGLVFTRPAQGTYVVDNLGEVLERSSNSTAIFPGKIVNVGIVSRMLVMNNISFYHSNIIAGIHKGLIENRANMTILPFHMGESETSLFTHASKSLFDAVIYLGPFDPRSLKTIIEKGAPSVILDFPLKNSGTDCVVIDNHDGARIAIEHIVSLGHRDIAIVAGMEDQPATAERLAGAIRAVEDNGMSKNNLKILKGNFTIESGYEAMRSVIVSGDIPEAVFFMNDEMAYGGVKAIKELSRLKIPDDISIVGFDNSAYALMSNPQLTTVSVPAMQMGKFATQRLFSKIKNRMECSPNFTQMETELIIRGSSSKKK